MGRTRGRPMDHDAKKDTDVLRRFSWEIISIGAYQEELRHFWARTLGVSGPQWMIVVALSDFDQGEGVPVNVVSKMLHVDPSFVTTQSKLLEKGVSSAESLRSRTPEL